MTYLDRVQASAGDLIKLRRYFHQHPELAFQEHDTAQKIAGELAALGCEVQTGIGQTGVVGLLRGAAPGPTLLIRADMDALPIQEETGLSYASQNEGVMHACGHDGHLAVLITTARLLAEQQSEISGQIKFVFQPAEEIGQGARAMIKDGILEDPVPDLALGLHLWNDLPVGTIAVEPGPVMAAFDEWQLILQGKGGHGAAPHQASNLIAALCQSAAAIEALPTREVDPQEPITLTIGTIQAGTRPNILPREGILTGTMRSYQPETREHLLLQINQQTVRLASSLGCSAVFNHQAGSPALVNDPGACQIVRDAAARELGQDQILPHQRSMLSEDFSRILEIIPGCYFFVGTWNDQAGINAPHHSPHFQIDEQSLILGAAVLTSAASSYLSG